MHKELIINFYYTNTSHKITSSLLNSVSKLQKKKKKKEEKRKKKKKKTWMKVLYTEWCKVASSSV